MLGCVSGRRGTWTPGVNARQAVVHEQETGLDSPDGQDLHLFDDKHHLGAELALRDFVRGQDDIGFGVDEVAARVGNDIHAGDKNRVGDLESVSTRQQRGPRGAGNLTMAKIMR